MGKPFLREFGFEISLLVLVFGSILLILSIFAQFLLDQTPDFLRGVVIPLYESHWGLWCLFIGSLLVIASGWVFGGAVKKLREFKKLIDTGSRAKFIRNLDRIEYLAWKLTSRHEQMFLEKKEELRIRK